MTEESFEICLIVSMRKRGSPLIDTICLPVANQKICGERANREKIWEKYVNTAKNSPVPNIWEGAWWLQKQKNPGTKRPPRKGIIRLDFLIVREPLRKRDVALRLQNFLRRLDSDGGRGSLGKIHEQT